MGNRAYKSKKRYKPTDIVLRAIVVIVFAVLLAVVLYLILKPTGIFESIEDYSVVFVIGVRRNSRMLNLNNAILEEKINRVVESYGYASIVVADGDPANQVNDYDFSLNEPSTFNKIRSSAVVKNNLLINKNHLREEIQNVRAKVPEADIIEAIDIAARKLKANTNGGTKEIVVLSTGLSTAGFLNFADENSWLYSDPSELLTTLKDNKNLPELENISVTWAHIADTAEPQQRLNGLEQSNLREIWKLIMTSSGAKKFEISDITPEAGKYDDASFPDEQDKLPAVSVVSQRSQITSVIVYPQEVSVQKGKKFDFGAVVNGINNPSQDVSWRVEGNNNIETMIDENGRLFVAEGETASALTVSAASTLDNKVISSAVVNLIIPPRNPTVTDLRFNQADNMVMDAGDTYKFSITIDGTDNPPQGAIWELSGNSDQMTRIDNNGRLFISPDETSISLTIKATSEYDSTKFSVIIVKVYRIVIPDTVDVKFHGNGADFVNIEQAKQDIEKWVKFIKSQDSGVYLFGCTSDASPKYTYDSHVNNSLARANAVRDLFVEYYKIDPSRIITKGLAYNNPWHKNNGIVDTASWNLTIAELNRRVVIMSADDEYAKSIYNDTWRR